MKTRKSFTFVQEVSVEGAETVNPAARIAIAGVVIGNPWTGRGYVADLSSGIEEHASRLGQLLAPQVVGALGATVEAFGKAAIVGTDGEIEHGSALIHTLKFGNHFRNATNSTSLLPAVEKRSKAGARFDIPLKHITDATLRSHHQTIEFYVADAPHGDEIVIALAAAAQGRPLQRLASFSSEKDLV